MELSEGDEQADKSTLTNKTSEVGPYWAVEVAASHERV
jgi:hypothetical protein